MSKTFFSTVNPDGQVYTRASSSDFGYTHAAWLRDWNARDQARTGKWRCSFSTSAHGACKNMGNIGGIRLSPVMKSATRPKPAEVLAWHARQNVNA